MSQAKNNERMLWWIADNKAEAGEMIGELAEKGARIVKVQRHGGPSQKMDVVFALDPARAMEILGRVPGDDEWLQPDDRKIPVTLNIYDGGVMVDAATHEMTIDQVSQVVDHASELILMRRNGQSLDAVLDNLEDALSAAEVIAARDGEGDSSAGPAVSM